MDWSFWIGLSFIILVVIGIFFSSDPTTVKLENLEKTNQTIFKRLDRLEYCINDMALVTYLGPIEEDEEN